MPATDNAASRASHAGYFAPILSVAIALVAAMQIWFAYDRVFESMSRQTRTDALIGAAYVGDNFAAAMLALQSIDVAPTSPGITISTEIDEVLATFRRVQQTIPAVQGLAYADATGRLAVTSLFGTTQAFDVSDRPYFRALRDNKDYSPRIDRPLVARPSGEVSILVTMRAETTSREFAGVALARIDPSRLARIFSYLDSASVELVDPRGNLYASSPVRELVDARSSGMPALDGPSVQRVIDAAEGRTRLMAYEPVPGTPLYVVAGMPYGSVVDEWLSHAMGVALVAALAICFAFLAAEFVKRRARDEMARLTAATARVDAAREDVAHFRDVARNKSDFLAHMGHEIRTPINAIVGFSDVIASDAMKLGVPQRYRDYAADIRFSADHLLEIINRILDMSKIEAGRWKLAVAPVDSAHILSAVRHLAEQRAAKEGVRLETDAASEDVELSADAQVLTQIVLNLTINAIKFAGEDRLVRMGCRSLPGARAEFWVADRGRGMTEEQARRALEPFETAGDGDRRSDTGLGLPLSLMFARLHGGTLEIETAPGKGTRVRVILPRGGPKLAANAA